MTRTSTRTANSNRFVISLLGAADDVADARAKFIGGPTPRLVEVMGKVDEDVGLTGDHLARSYAGQHQSTGLPIVNIEFNSEGTRKFGELTTRIAGTPNLLAIFLDDKELISPGASRAITGGAAYIEGRDFTFERVRDIALLLESGRLPIPIELIQERDVDAILGADSLAKSVVAGLAGLGLVLLFMALYYRLPGIIAAVALIIYAGLLLAIFKTLPVTLTLSGVAAVILSIGMAVDANILIFERMKEELRAGRDAAIRDRYRVQPCLAGHTRRQRVHAHNVRHPFLVRRHAGRVHREGLCDYAGHRSGHQYV